MAGNSFGRIFRISTYGESHGAGIGVIIDGCPAGLLLDLDLIRRDLARRRPGQSAIVTQRQETEEFQILSGLFEGQTTGTPLHIFIPNQNAKSKDYSGWAELYRPSHADYSYAAKYGIRDYRGGGRSSARETAARVAAGAVARQILAQYDMKIWAYVKAVGEIECTRPYWELDPTEVERNPVRAAEPKTAQAMEALIRAIRKAGDSIGGQITLVIEGVPPGLGEPVFDRLQADLAKAMLSINACKGFEYGSGFAGTKMRGSQHNDPFVMEDGQVKTTTNYSGGIQGGISNGMDIYCNLAFKPVATLMQAQQTINQKGEPVTLAGKGRHDPCVLPRAVPIVEAMAALVILDHYFIHQSRL